MGGAFPCSWCVFSLPLLDQEGQGIGTLSKNLQTNNYLRPHKMGSKYCLVFLMLATAMVVARSATLFPDAASMGAALSGCRSGECFDLETEMLLDSEINNRLLRQ